MNTPVGRLVTRVEGNMYMAYYVSTQGEVQLGGVGVNAVMDRPRRKAAFRAMMQSIVDDIIKESTPPEPPAALDPASAPPAP